MYIQKCEVLSSFLSFIVLTDIEIKNHDNPFQPTGLFIYPPPPPKKKYQKTREFLMFSGGIKKYQWNKMDEKKV